MNPKEKAAGGNLAAIQKTHPINSKNKKKKQFDFDRTSLPKPAEVLAILDVRYELKGFSYVAYCPFHANGQEKNPSLSVHATEGYYRCYACGAKGGDVIALYRAVTNASFGETLKALGVCHA